MINKLNNSKSQNSVANQRNPSVSSALYHWLIKSYIIGLTLLLLSLLSACSLFAKRGSGNIITEARDIRDFNRVVFGGTGELNLSQSVEESLTITTDDNLMNYIESEVRDGTLFIGIKETWGDRISPSQPIRFTLKVKEMIGLDVSGTVSAETGEIITESLTVNVSGSSDLTISALQAQRLALHLSGSNEVKLLGTGEVSEQEIVISGSSNYHAPELRGLKISVTINGSGNATVWATDLLDVTMSGNGSVNYYGNPRVTQKGSGVMNIKSLGIP